MKSKILLFILALTISFLPVRGAGKEIWKSTNGPDGATIYSGFQSGNLFFAGTDDGVYRFDLAQPNSSWAPYPSVAKKLNVKVNALVTGGFGAVYAGTSEGVYRSDGVDWTPVGDNKGEVNALVIMGNTLYSAAPDDVYKIDISNGVAWQAVQTQGGVLPGVKALALSVDGSILYAGNLDGVYKINPAWAQPLWFPFLQDLNAPEANLSSIKSLSRTAEGYLYAVGGIQNKVYRINLNDANDTWIVFNDDLTHPLNNASSFVLLTDGTTAYAGTLEGIYKASSNGLPGWLSFPDFGNPATNLAHISFLSLSNDESILYAGVERQGLWQIHLTGGAQWSEVAQSKGLHGAYVDDLLSTRQGVFAAGGDSISNYALTNGLGGGSFAWKVFPSVTGKPTDAHTLLLASNNILYAGTDTGVQQIDLGKAGDTWKPFQAIGSENILNVHALLLSSSVFYAGTDAGVYKVSPDNFLPQWVAFPNLSNVKTLAQSGTLLFAGTDQGVFKIDLNQPADTWHEFPEIFGPPGNLSSVNAFLISGDVFLAATQEGVYKISLTNPGDTWHPFPNDVGNPEANLSGVHSLFLNGEGSALYAASDTGVFFNDVKDFAASPWIKISDGLPATSIAKVKPVGGLLYAAASGHGVYNLKLCGDGVVDATGETCDDANTDDSDGCRNNCTLPTCGDGKFDPPAETCDKGAANSDQIADACRTNCVQAHCGDAVKDSNEECDDGVNDGTLCTAECKLPVGVTATCGDGIVASPETCDIGNGAMDTCGASKACIAAGEAKECSCQDKPSPDVGSGLSKGGCNLNPSQTSSGVFVLILFALVTLFIKRTRKINCGN